MPGRRIESEAVFIREYLAPLSAAEPLAFSLADDAAVVRPPDGHDIIVTTDPVREGVHFFASDNPRDVAWKALAVNASDIAAKGGKPIAYTMALGLPDQPTVSWATAFAAGLKEAQSAFGCALIGGDTDRVAGPLSIAVTMFGSVPRGRMVPRRGARVGDSVYVTGTIGDAALGLDLRRGQGAFQSCNLGGARKRFLLDRYLRPIPRLSMTTELMSYARAALDVSDGLVADVGKLVGAHRLDVELMAVPMSEAAREVVALYPEAYRTVLTGGCDYEIVAAVSDEDMAAFEAAAERSGCPLTRLGVIRAAGRENSGVRLTNMGQLVTDIPLTGYDHFAI